MATNMEITQAATILNAIVKQATGQDALTAITGAADFISAAQVALKTGYDPIVNAISQVWCNTVFADRAYSNPLSTLRMSGEKYGNAIRKLSPIAAEARDDDAYKWPVAYDSTQTYPYGDGQSVDHYEIVKQKTLQTNFYGSSVYEQAYTVFKNQLDVAFSDAGEFVRYNAMNLQERMNDRESFEEGKARIIQLNLIAALLAENNADRVIHLLTEYNTLTGLSLTATTVYQPANFTPFIRWCYSRIRTLIRQMGARSDKFQTNITGSVVLRHSKPENIRVAMYSPLMEEINAMVLSETYHDDRLKLPTFESIPYWQSIDTPAGINFTPTYTNTSGVVTTGTAQSNNAVVGLIHDKDALGYAMLDTVSSVTPMNAKGLYWTNWYHARFRAIMDNTEKAIILCLD